jgi:outer membrane protein insertion porin family
MQSDTDTLSVLVSEAGYPHVQVTAATEFSDDRTGVNIRYVIDPGRFVKMGEIFYTGNFRTKPRVIDRVHGLRPGEPFSLKRSLEAPKKIRDMGIFDSVQLVTIGLREQTETVNFIADLEEKKPYFFEVGLGYQSDRGVYGRSKVGDRNLWGLNKDAWIGGEVSETGYKAETALREPRLWGTRIEMTVSAFAEETQAFNQTFGTRIIGTAVNLTRPLADRLDVGLGFRYEQREQFGVAQTQVQGVTTERRSNLVTSPFISYDARDSFVRPQEGIFSEFKIDLSKGVQNATDDFTKYRLDLRSFTSPLKRLTLAVMGRAGTIRPYGDNRIIPADQRFYLGGMNTVRGYDENLLFFDANGDPVGGNSALNGSIEGRIGIGYNFELTTFFDIGSVIQDPDFSGAGFRSSFGFGLLYQTAIGPIGVMYGWKIDPRPEESPGQWHFTIGYTF